MINYNLCLEIQSCSGHSKRGVCSENVVACLLF